MSSVFLTQHSGNPALGYLVVCKLIKLTKPFMADGSRAVEKHNAPTGYGNNLTSH